MSQGYIGYDLQNALREEMLDRGIDQGVATVLTQVEVDPEDPAFAHPTKPIGSFMTQEEAIQSTAESAEKGLTYLEDLQAELEAQENAGNELQSGVENGTENVADSGVDNGAENGADDGIDDGMDGGIE